MSRKIIRNLAVMLFLGAGSYVLNAQTFPLYGVNCSCSTGPGCTCTCSANGNGCSCSQKC